MPGADDFANLANETLRYFCNAMLRLCNRARVSGPTRSAIEAVGRRIGPACAWGAVQSGSGPARQGTGEKKAPGGGAIIIGVCLRPKTLVQTIGKCGSSSIRVEVWLY
jgi:hypothetical protein